VSRGLNTIYYARDVALSLQAKFGFKFYSGVFRTVAVSFET